MLGIPATDRARIAATVAAYDESAEHDRVEMARLREDPSLLPAAVEELLRFTSPVNHANDRFTTHDVPVGDVVIPAGQWVFPAISSANRDPTPRNASISWGDNTESTGGAGPAEAGASPTSSHIASTRQQLRRRRQRSHT